MLSVEEVYLETEVVEHNVEDATSDTNILLDISKNITKLLNNPDNNSKNELFNYLRSARKQKTQIMRELLHFYTGFNPTQSHRVNDITFFRYFFSFLKEERYLDTIEIQVLEEFLVDMTRYDISKEIFYILPTKELQAKELQAQN